MATEQPQNDTTMSEPTTQTVPNANQDEEQQEPKYGGFTRFEIELEFVQCLANPHYLLHLATLTTITSPFPDFQSLSIKDYKAPDPSSNPGLSLISSQSSFLHEAPAESTPSKTQPATTPLLAHPPFIAYLQYLQYFSQPPYLKYLTYPGPTLKNLELLQSERFRREVLSPDVVGALVEEGRGAVAGGGADANVGA